MPCVRRVAIFLAIVTRPATAIIGFLAAGDIFVTYALFLVALVV
jgi:hypothetical protein